MNTQFLLYIPGWVKALAIMILLLVAAFSLVMVALSWDDPVNKKGFIQPAMTMAQVALSGLAILLMFIFSKRGASAERFNSETEEYLENFLPFRFQQIDFKFPESFEFKRKNFMGNLIYSVGATKNTLKVANTTTKVVITKPKNVPFALYDIHAYGLEMRVFVQVNIREIVLIYYIPVNDENIDRVKKVVLPTFEDSEKARGYYVEEQIRKISELNDRECLIVQLTWSVEKDFLLHSNEKLYVANMIALITRSVFMKCKENNIDLNCKKTKT